MGSNDSFTETSSQSWFSRLGDSIKSVGLGFLLFIAAFPVLWMNEGCAVRTALGLEEGAKSVIVLPDTKVDSSKNGKLVYVTGDATTQETITDPILGFSDKAIRIIRAVQMYQWKESSQSHTEKKLGGGTETKTTYTYSKDWSSSVVKSDSFKQPAGHNNPSVMEVPADSVNASNVTLGDFTLGSNLISMITQGEPVTMTQEMIGKLPANLRAKAKLSGNELYIGDNAANPQVGDLKITLTVVKPQKVSVIGQQQGNTFVTFKTSENTDILMLSAGTVAANQMFAQAQSANKMKTWIIRLVGFLMMYIGIGMIFKPIVTFGDVVPFIGSILNFGIGIFAFIVALAFSLIVIAIAWVAHRPLIGIPLLIIGVGAIVGGIIMGKKKKAQAAA